jgi:DNA replication ATP-dependent helicase Dna2
VYALNKRALSQYVRRECRRRLRLDLYKGTDARDAAGAPDRDAGRPGLALLVAQGREFERQKFQELVDAFPGRVVHGPRSAHVPGEEMAFGHLALADVLDAAGPDTFLIEAQYVVPSSFMDTHGLADLRDGALGRAATLELAQVRPDILHVVGPTGAPREAISREGLLVALDPADGRLGLRIIDVKLGGEPSPSHFAELAYYGMTLAAWLEETGRAGRFVVLKDAAIWPGKHEASDLRRIEAEDKARGVGSPDLPRYLQAWERDLETIPAEVVLGRTRRFLAVDLREVLLEPRWQALPFHVDTSCSGCDYLGYDWKKGSENRPETDGPPAPPRRKDDRSLYCWQDAKVSDHLSLVTGLPRGACGKLREGGATDIRHLAALRPENRIFEGHQRLRAGRSLFQARSDTLSGEGQATIPLRVGTSAVLPRRSDVSIALSVDYDVGSGLTFAIGYKIMTRLPTELVHGDDDGTWFKSRRVYSRPRVMLVDSKSLDVERDALVDTMGRLVADMRAAGRQVTQAYADLGKPDHRSTGQVYLWDRLNYEHLRRVMGRHLLALLRAPDAADRDAPAPMAWFFPPETVIEDPDFTSKNSPVTIVGDTVHALLAANVPHHYSLLNVANAYHPSWYKPREDGGPHFRMPGLFVDPLSDQLPSERGHEIWNKRSPFRSSNWQEYRETLAKSVNTRLDALLAVTDRLVEDLGRSLSANAPRVEDVLGSTRLLGAMSWDSETLYQHARLMAAAATLENELLMAMPPHQREAAFESVRLTAKLTDADRMAALQAMERADLDGDPDVLVFRISERSAQASVKAGEFNLTLMPEDMLDIQHMKVAGLKARHPALQRLLGPPENSDYRTGVREACKVAVAAFDRVGQTIALKLDGIFIPSLVRAGVFNLDVDGATRFAIVDPLVVDYFVRWRLRPALRGIATPPLSQSRPLFRDTALTRLRMRRGPRLTGSVPAERFIWDADNLAAEGTGMDPAPILAAVAASGCDLTPRQADAVASSVAHRLALLWGPPGTGKSATAAALLLGRLWEARRSGKAVRIAITGPTWVAIDTVAKRVPGLLRELGMFDDVLVARLASTPPTPDSVAPELMDHVVETRGAALAGIVDRLSDPTRSTVVAATAHQLGRLCDEDAPLRPFFDLMLVDEASQMSVAHAVVAYTTLAEGASLTVVGDDLQMPPIQPVAPPEGAGHLVGSLYDFYRFYRKGEPGAAGIMPVMLDRSFRSNREIVDFVRLAGYGPELEAAFPNLRMRLVPGGHTRVGGTTPTAVAVNRLLDLAMDPERPLIALVHSDEFSSQRNDPEAGLVASLVCALRGRLLPAAGDEPLDPVAFYRHGIGIVTPHRAQQAAVIERLLTVAQSRAEREALMAAVDTVERFQGQEKTAMIASFGLGDVDQISAEEEFLYSLNRFNVIASRAKTKLIVLMSRKLVDYLPRDPDTLRKSRLVKHFADGHLPSIGRVSLRGLGECEIRG